MDWISKDVSTDPLIYVQSPTKSHVYEQAICSAFDGGQLSGNTSLSGD